MPILVFCVSEETLVVDLNLAVLVSVLQSQFNVLDQGLAFLLCKAHHNGKQHLSFGIHRVNVLFFKENRNVLLLQFPDIFQAVQHISGKSVDGFRDDHVNPAYHTFLYHAVEFIMLLYIHSNSLLLQYVVLQNHYLYTRHQTKMWYFAKLHNKQ